MANFQTSGQSRASTAKFGASVSGHPAPGGTQSTQRLLALLDQFSTEQPAQQARESRYWGRKRS
jgi:hypothetical protein